MKRNSLIHSILLAILTLTLALGFSRESSRAERDSAAPPSAAGSSVEKLAAPKGEVLVTNRLDIDFSKRLVTFIELGADRCIPCKAMKPIMTEVAAKFPEDVQVVFYDIWKDPEPGRHYRIQLIPTQVFLDREGREFHRNVGFFAKEEILNLLAKKGVKK